MKYIIKNNLPTTPWSTSVFNDTKRATDEFMSWVIKLSAKHATKVFFRTEPLRGQIRVEVDGFYYYIELFIKNEEL
jgi:hypothetical protein